MVAALVSLAAAVFVNDKIQDSRFKHHLFRKYTVIHNGIFIMSM